MNLKRLLVDYNTHLKDISLGLELYVFAACQNSHTFRISRTQSENYKCVDIKSMSDETHSYTHIHTKCIFLYTEKIHIFTKCIFLYTEKSIFICIYIFHFIVGNYYSLAKTHM